MSDEVWAITRKSILALLALEGGDMPIGLIMHRCDIHSQEDRVKLNGVLSSLEKDDLIRVYQGKNGKGKRVRLPEVIKR